MATVTIRCCRCKAITGVQHDASSPAGGRTAETYQPCYDCQERDRRRQQAQAQTPGRSLR